MSINHLLTTASDHIILCVDDDADDLFFLTTAVQKANSALHTATASNGEEALRYLQGAGRTGLFPSLIILDINMPGLDGKQVLAQLKADPLFRNIPVVMYTTSSSLMDKTYCARYGVPMVTKPVRYEEIMASVQGMLSVLEA